MTEVSTAESPRPWRVGMIVYGSCEPVQLGGGGRPPIFHLAQPPELTVVAGRDEARCGRQRSGSASVGEPIGVGSRT